MNFYFQVFNEPTLMMQHLLNNTKSLSLGTYKHDTDCKYEPVSSQNLFHWIFINMIQTVNISLCHAKIPVTEAYKFDTDCKC